MPALSSFTAKMELNKVATPGWDMTFADLAFDIETIWYAFLWFRDPVYGVPAMNIEVKRFGTSLQL